MDDVKDLGYKPKFFGQIAATLVVIFYGGLTINNLGDLLPYGLDLPQFIAIPLTLVAIIGVTNAINLSDGLDGLAGGISLLSFLCIGYLGYRCNCVCTTMICVAIIGGLFGFLRFNTFPATVFMGDAGSQLIGFLGITLSLKLTQGNTPLSPVLPLLLVGFPVLDTLTVMAARKLHGRPVFSADKNHFHHKLMNIGLYHTEAVFFIYVIQAVLITFAFMFRYYSEWLLLSFYLLFTVPIFAGVLWANKTDRRLKRPGLFDFAVKNRLKIFKDENFLIKLSFISLEMALPVFLLFSIFLLKDVPVYISASAIFFILMIISSTLFFKSWIGSVLRISYYLMVPYLVFMSETTPVMWAKGPVTNIYNIAFIILAVFVVLTIKYTRRIKGFKATPMDFIILFVALIIPNLPDPGIQNYHMGVMATKIIVLFFSFEVWVCELRGKVGRPQLCTTVALVILAVRGFLG